MDKAKFSSAKEFHQSGKIAQAIAIYMDLLLTNESNPQLLFLLGVAYLQLDQYDRALVFLGKSIKLYPNNSFSYYNYAVALQSLTRFDEALESYEYAIKIQPDYVEAYSNRGAVLSELGRFDEAVASYQRAIQLQPDYAEAYSNLGVALSELGRFDEALKSYNSALGLSPQSADVYYNRGNAFSELQHLEDALVSYDQAIQLNPSYAEAYNNRGVALRDLGRLEDALLDYDRAIQLNPNYAEAYNNHAVALSDLGRLEEALVSYDCAIQLNPNYAEAYNNRGVALRDLGRLEDALECSDRAIQLNPNYPEAYNSYAITLYELRKFEKALVSFYKAIQLKPEIDYLWGNLFQTKIQLCDWQDYEQFYDQLIKRTLEQKRTSTPFAMLALTDDAEVQRQSAEIYLKHKHPLSKTLPTINAYLEHRKIRIGYFSADFHNHATMHLMAELFENHDKEKFETYGFSFGPNSQDEWRIRAKSCFDHFLNVTDHSDADIASLARNLEIDIAIDLKGFTKDERASIFAHQAAPIQVNYLGYPGTMGADYINYIIADPILIPKNSQQYYSEKIVYLPNSYQVNVKEIVISDKVLTREDVGLPSNAFVFCSFNNNYKITPATFDGWMQILKAVEGSVLWIFKSNDTVVENLRKEAELRGVSGNRLVFASSMPVEEHLKRIQLADLFLDTFPYNAHTTASDALRVGLPIVTLMGDSFASRVAGSLLNAVGLPELITTTPEAYESLAIELANSPEKLHAIKTKLQLNLPTSPLYDSKLFTRHIEAAYQEMYDRYHKGLPPDHIYIN